MSSLIEKLSKFAKQFSTPHEKINNTHDKKDTMKQQLQVIINCLQNNLKTTIDNSTGEMDIDSQQ